MKVVFKWSQTVRAEDSDVMYDLLFKHDREMSENYALSLQRGRAVTIQDQNGNIYDDFVLQVQEVVYNFVHSDETSMDVTFKRPLKTVFSTEKELNEWLQRLEGNFITIDKSSSKLATKTDA